MMKQVIIIRKDLKCRRGKEISQGAHASMLAILPNLDDPRVKEWLAGAFTKICVCVNSEEELLELNQKALDNFHITGLIRDNGDTEFHGVKTYTALAIGPGESEELDKITGHLKLY